MRVNADQLTDQQIREFRGDAAQGVGGLSWHSVAHACWALGESRWFAGVDGRIPHGFDAQYRREGRLRVAAAINARQKGG